MSSISLALRDSTTMLRRDIRHSFRNLAMTLSGFFVPIIMLVLFVYFFGGQMQASFGGNYLNYIVPGIIILTIGSGCPTTALNLCMDLAEGIITRFRTMPIARVSVLTGHVVGSLLRTLVTITLVFGVALLMGFRSSAGLIEWIEAFGLLVLFTFAVTWIGVLFGLVGKTPAGANSLAQIFQTLLPFTSSAFARPDTMPDGVRWFVEYQPFTPVIETLRGLLTGTPLGNQPILAVAWCIVLSLFGYLTSRAVYNR